MKALFEKYTCAEDYKADGLKFISPMLAKEIEDEEKQDACLNSSNYYVEEKFDGTRATLHFFTEHNRCFSRRVSEKTGWLCENSDSVPHIRDIVIPELAGTILDGEMFIPYRPFKDVSSTLNCKWDKALERQKELGNIVFHAFDILYYKGEDTRNFPLYKRKEYLREVVETIDSDYIHEVDFYRCDSLIPITVVQSLRTWDFSGIFPTLYRDISEHTVHRFTARSFVTPKGYYEYIVATGGEGVIVKPIDGVYREDKRGWEYSKIKKFITRDVIITGFNEPTDEYKGKFPTIDKWDYWETSEKDVVDLSEFSTKDRTTFKNNWYPEQCRPVSKFYAKNWVGNIVFGVIITPEELASLPKNKKFTHSTMTIEGKKVIVLEVGECSGVDEEMRQYLTDHKEEMVGTTLEVKANEIFKDTGKLRHPRFHRLREDKSPLQCVWEYHVNRGVL